jgi:hypothetical protein
LTCGAAGLDEGKNEKWFAKKIKTWAECGEIIA